MNTGRHKKRFLGIEFWIQDKELVAPTINQIKGVDRDHFCTGKCCIITTIIILLVIILAIVLGVISPLLNPVKSPLFVDHTCDDHKCLHNSSCISSRTNYSCACTPDYSGYYCDIYEPCWNDPCAGEGLCIKNGTSYTCTCGSKYLDFQCYSQNISVVSAFVKISKQMIAGAFEDNSVRIWDDYNAPQSRQILFGHTDFVRSIVQLTNGRIVSGSCDTTIRAWIKSSNTWQNQIIGNHSNCVNGLVEIPGSYLLSGSSDQKLILWKYDTNRLVDTFSTDGSVLALAYYPKLQYVAVGLESKNIDIMGFNSYVSTDISLIGKASVKVFLKSNTKIITGHSDGKIFAWATDLTNEIEFNGVKHTSSVNALISLGKSFDLLASASDDCLIKIWESKSNAYGLSFTFAKEHNQKINALTVLNNGLLISGSADKTIRIWNVSNRAYLGIVSYSRNGVKYSHARAVNALAVLNNSYLASASDDGLILIWDLNLNDTQITVVLQNTLILHKDRVTALTVLSSDILVSASADKSVILWDGTSLEMLKTLTGHTNEIISLSNLPNNSLASSTNDGAIILWFNIKKDSVNSILRETLPAKSSTAAINAVIALEKDNILSAINDTKLIKWSKSLSNNLLSKKSTLTGHTDAVLCLTFTYNSNLNADLLASGSRDKKIIIWDLNTLTNLKTLLGHQNDVTALIRLESGFLASGSVDTTIRIWDQDFYNQYILNSHKGAITSLVSIDETVMLSGSTDTSIMIWKIKTDLTLKNTLYHALSVQDTAELKNDNIATCSDDDSVKVWGNEANFEKSTNLTGHLDYVYALDTLSDGYLASASKDVSVRIWDAENLKLVHTLYSHKRPVISIVAIKPILYKNNRFIHFASGSCDSTIKIWDNSYNLITTLKGHTDCVNSLAVYNYRYLISGGNDSKIMIWSLGETFAQIKTLDGHRMQVNAVTVLKNSDVASGSSDNTIKIWKSVYSKRDVNFKATCLAVLNNNGSLVTSLTNKIILRDKNNLNTATILTPFEDQDVLVTALIVTRFGLIAGFSDGKIALFDDNFAVKNNQTNHISEIIILTNSSLSSELIASISKDNTIIIWELKADGLTLKKTINHSSDILAAIFFLFNVKGSLSVTSIDKKITIYSPIDESISTFGLTSEANALIVLKNGNLVTGCKDSTINVHDPNSLRIIKKISINSNEITSFLILPNTDYLVSTSLDQTIKIWDPTTFKLITTLKGTEGYRRIVIIDSIVMASLTVLNNVEIWDKPPESFTVDRTLTGHMDAVLDLTVLNNGFLASASKDKSIKIWDNNLNNIVNVTMITSGHKKPVLALKVLRNNDLISTSEDRTAKIWSTNLFVNISAVQ